MLRIVAVDVFSGVVFTSELSFFDFADNIESGWSKTHRMVTNSNYSPSPQPNQAATDNPYHASAVPACGAAGADFPSTKYMFRHALGFNSSLMFLTFLLISVMEGPVNAIRSFDTQRGYWLAFAGIGVGLWLGHALAICFRHSIRRIGPYVNAIVGAGAFLFCVMITRAIADVGPNSLRVVCSTEYIRIPVCLVGSIFVVELLAALVRKIEMLS